MNEQQLAQLGFVKGADGEWRKATGNRDKGLCAVQPQSVKRVPLDVAPTGEEACWYDAAKRFEIEFVVYSQRPCDWDGYDIKALQDFCVTAGMLQGDGWKTLSGRVLSRKAATKEEERTEVFITALTHNQPPKCQ